MEANDSIYRGAYKLSLVGGLLAAAGVVVFIALLGGFALPILNHLLLRIAIGYGMMWIVLMAMQSAGGGLAGFPVTATAWILTNLAITVGWFASPLVWMSGFGNRPPTNPMPPDLDLILLLVLMYLVVQGLGAALAGWVHGD